MELKENNKQRDLNLANKLEELKLNIFEKLDCSVTAKLAHAEPSAETRVELKNIKENCSARGTDFALMNREVIALKDDMKQIKESAKSMERKLDVLLEKSDRKFAAKWVEKFNIGLIATVLLSVLGTILYNLGLKQ
jgi:hypothetical protein